MYAVIQLAGKQYQVSEGETLTVNKLEDETGQSLTVSDVLLVANGSKVSVGTPLVKGATVTLEVVRQQKGEKIRVATYKAKSRVRKVRGHRQHETVLKVTKIAG
jgi:large subunit ribosomal protein L21